MEFKMNNRSENPFYGQKELLALWQQGSGKNVSKSTLINLLDAAWKASENDIKFRQAFFVIILSYGEITNRHHNILKDIKKLDNGGGAWRDGFVWSMEWMRKNTPEQYYVFLAKDIFRQFVGLLSILINKVKTLKGKTTVLETVDTIKEHDITKLASYLAEVIKLGNPAEKNLIAKALTRPRFSKRQKTNREGEKIGSRDLKPEVLANMKSRELLLKAISDILGWKYVQHKNNIHFTDYYAWKKEFGGALESVLFSSGRIKEFDHDEFHKWLEGLPAGARYRVRRRLLTKENGLVGKWTSKFGDIDLGMWFLEWEALKESKQAEERVLTEKVRQGTASEDEVIKLAKVKKEAKVNTGGSDIKDEMEKLLAGTSNKREADTMVHSLMSKMELQVPVAIIADTSSSMGFRDRMIKTKHGDFYPYQAARLLTTLLMLKNPSQDLDQFLVTFESRATFHHGKTIGSVRENQFTMPKSVEVDLIDRTKPFSDNYDNISKVINHSGGTNIADVAVKFKDWVEAGDTEAERLVRRETIQQYPVFIIVSDGDMNSSYSSKSSFTQYQQNMRQWTGWEGVTVVFDVTTSTTKKSDKFDSIDNFIHFYGWNVGNLNALFTKLHDLDIIDIYTPLDTLLKNNRYDIIKSNVL